MMHTSKNFTVDFSDDGGDVELPLDALVLSDRASQELASTYLSLARSKKSIAQKVKAVRGMKAAERSLYSDMGIWKILKEGINIEGAVRISPSEIDEFTEILTPVDSDGNTSQKSGLSRELAVNLLRTFGSFSGDNFTFRNERYYFLFPAVKIEKCARLTSINDFVITALDAGEFIKSLCEHYNKIDQVFNLYRATVRNEFVSEISKNKNQFINDIVDKISPKRIAAIREKILSGAHDTGHAPADEMFSDQWESALVELEHLRNIVEDYAHNDSAITHLSAFIARKGPLLSHAKIVFGFDIDMIVNRHFQIEMPVVLKKITLGLLDAKMNILAFLQNILQICANVNFLDPDYPGSLVFEQDIVRNIKNTNPEAFERFKAAQEEIGIKLAGEGLLGELDVIVGIFLDILLDKGNVSYLRIAEQGLYSGNFNSADISIPSELSNALDIFRHFFSLLDTFIETCEQMEEKKRVKKHKKGLEYISNARHVRIKQKAYARLIRLYREENDPAVMIKTAQNALNHVLSRGYDADKDVLHIMSVNYGGALTGFIAKQVFLQSLNKGQVLANAAAVIYSLYDVRNANSFVKLAEYPFSRLIADETMPEIVRKEFAKKNWLLIFDDNTNSGETLDNIRKLAKETSFFGRIDMFPCRASYNVENFKSSLSDHQKLAMIATSALEVRRCRVNSENIRYKELFGTIVGRRVWDLVFGARKQDIGRQDGFALQS